MGRLSDVRARLECFPEVVDHLLTLREEMERVAEESPHATLVRQWISYSAYADRYLPLSLAPILDRSLIHAGIAVGWHSAPLSELAPPQLRDYASRLLMGRLVHATKQYDTTLWSPDMLDVQSIGHLAAYALASTNFGQETDLIVSVPSSRGSNSLPFHIAKDLAFLTGIRYAPAGTITFGRLVPQIKQVRNYWEERELLHGAMDAKSDLMRGMSVLLVDDICRTGTTIHECARACHGAGASRVTVLTVSKTFEFQRIPDTQRAFDDMWLES